jgi:hypothetical protein
MTEITLLWGICVKVQKGVGLIQDRYVSQYSVRTQKHKGLEQKTVR